MAATTYTLQVDDIDKKRAEQVFNELGMTFATGINVYIKTVSRQQKIPFELVLNPQVSKEEKQKAFAALDGILAGHDVILEKEREERILAK